MASARIDLTFRNQEAKLIYLAVAYHLGRPGSELDPITKQPLEHGLAEVARALQPQLRLATATISLDNTQAVKLQSGMLGSITELKAFSMLQPRTAQDGSRRRSTVPGFDGTLLHLFPEVEDDPETSLEIAERMLMLKRNVDQRLAELPPEEPEQARPARKPRWWPFGR